MEVFIGLLILLAVVTVTGHVIWMLLATIVKSFTESSSPNSVTRFDTWRCSCGAAVPRQWKYCGPCGAPQSPGGSKEILRELTIAERVFDRLHSEAKITVELFEAIKSAITAERTLLTVPPPIVAKPSTEHVARPTVQPLPSVSVQVTPAPEPARTVQPKPQRRPRRSFTEVLNSFMEESNIRWGEIIGGLLIIGCSTALVVSLWAQISEIPVLKFLIFTTVTALLFGTGMYTDHRWKLPTTSRGILTIATLLVPLNFLAIAAVSSGESSGVLVLASELIAPAIFLCLVYFAGRIITPGCAHLLAAGILGSSVGQLLVRHFANAEASPVLQVAIGAFPVLCYLISVGLALRRVLADDKVDETETTTVFTILGTMSFAALLPFGLLLYKSGPIAMSMMYLAPIVTLWGVPMLATGTVLWRRIKDKELIASQTAGIALGLLGLLISLAGILLAWPNPASIVPAALMNVAILSVLAVVLEIPTAHVLAAGCFALAGHVLFQVMSGRIGWHNWRVESLVNISLDISSGWALIGTFAILVIVSEWLQKSRQSKASIAYLVSACVAAVISVAVITAFGSIAGASLQIVWLAYLIFSTGAFWIAWRRNVSPFTWVGAALFLFSLASAFAWTIGLSFPWQTALLVHASVCTLGAIALSRRTSWQSLSKPLNVASLITLVIGVLSFFQTNPWQVTWMQTERLFWISGILLLSLWLNRRQLLFVALQIALTATAILGVKATLQGFDWYNYLPHAFLHPAALQIQATVLALLSLVWIATRGWFRRVVTSDQHSLSGIWKLLDTKHSVDRIIPWILLGAFVVFTIYGAATGIAQEFAQTGVQFNGWNIAGFPHGEALGFGSWVLLGLLTLIMLANAWERRKAIHIVGALVVALTVIPLLAGRFEAELATASAWRFVATLFLLGGSVAFWNRKQIFALLKSIAWPSLDQNGEQVAVLLRTVLLFGTLTPFLLLTGSALVRAILLQPAQSPISGVFALFNPVVSYSIPLVIIAILLSGYAVRERMPEANFYSALLFNFGVTLAYLLTVLGPTNPVNSVVFVRVLQLNAVTFAVHSLISVVLRKSWLRQLDTKPGEVDNLIKLEMCFGVVLNLLAILPLAAGLIIKNYNGPASITAGEPLGWFTLALTSLSYIVVKRSRTEKIDPLSLAFFAVCVVSLVAFGCETVSNSLGICFVTAGIGAVAWLMFAASYLPQTVVRPSVLELLNLDEKWSRSAIQLSTVLGGLAVFMSLRIIPVVRKPGISWTLMPLVSMCALAACLQFATLRRVYIYLAAIFLSVAAALWWFVYVPWGDLPVLSFLDFAIAIACVSSWLWLYLELRARRLRAESTRFASLSYHHIVVFCSMAVFGLTTWIRYSYPEARGFEWFTNFTFITLLGLVIATLWDARAKYATAALYVVGLLGAAIGFQQLQLSTQKLLWTTTIFLSLYTLATALLWHKRADVIASATRLGIVGRVPPEKTELAWLNLISIALVCFILASVFGMDMSFASFPMRLSAGLAVVLPAITFGLFAEGIWSERWRRASIGTFVVGAVLFGWAWLTPGVDSTWLNRSVILMVEALVFTSIYVLSLEQLHSLSSKWAQTIKSCLPGLLIAGFCALMFCLGTEVSYQLRFGTVNIHPISLIAVGVALVGAIVAPILFALSPTHDPLNLSERRRMKYVYAAEVMLSLLFLHVRLTMPWLFHGFFEQYWPLVVMTIAFGGVLISEALRNQNLLVLSKPIERTGAFLPLLPIAGFWIATSQVDYSALLFVVGAFYGLLSILRKSFVFGLLAAVFGNAALWYVLHRTADYRFLQHPQLWLVPVALSALAACYLNEDNLSDDQMATVRYLSLVTIYASSTADIFINGVANSPWLPLILSGFSLAGVFAGIMLRIRGLLFLGSVFLLLSITTMIWYASANFGWTWLWYVAGIATGATIIFMFAVFEKKRSEVLRLVEGLKEWEM